jgi:hypothetical protein
MPTVVKRPHRKTMKRLKLRLHDAGVVAEAGGVKLTSQSR